MPLSAGNDQNQTTSRILNKLQYAMTDVAADITTATTSDIVLMLDQSDNYEIKYADSANVREMIGTTATAAELNFVAGVTAGTATASKAVVLDASKGIATITSATITTLTTTTVTAAGAVTSSSATAGMGYATGAGGTVTQATSKSTGATLSKLSGAITMNAESLAAGTIVSFVLTNTAVAATDVLILNHISGGTVGSYTLNAQAAAGSATINVRNNTAGALAEAIVIQFAVIKGVNA